jgi:hypothetical protein
MRFNLGTILPFFVISVGLGGLVGCGGTVGSFVTLSRVISLSPNPVSLSTSQSTHFKALSTTLPGGATSNVTILASWTSSVPSIATVAADGTALCQLAGVTEITASYDGSSGTARLTCLRAPSVISISPNPVSLTMSQSTHFKALATAAGGTTSDVTMLASWTSSLPSIATIASDGTALCQLAGVTAITASDAGDSGTAQLTCLRAPSVIAISPNPVSLKTAQSTHFTAVATAPGGIASDVTMLSSWTSSSPSVAIVAPGGVALCKAAGTTQISASDAGDNGTAQLTCLRAASVITISPNPVSMNIAQFTHFTAVATAPGGATSNVTMLASWISSSPSIATVAPGGVTLCQAAGTTQITASNVGDSGAAQLTCFRAPSVISISPNPVSLNTAQSTHFTAVATAPGGTTSDVTMLAFWTSSLPSIATVAPGGTALCKAAGVTQITASDTGDSGTAQLTCLRAPSVISISPDPVTMNTAQSAHFTAVATAPGGATSDVTMLSSWTSSSPSVATVAPGGTALCKVAGATQITASDQGDSGTAQLTCLRVPSVILISPNPVSLNTAQSTRFTALATAPGGTPSDVTMLSSWVSSSPSVATIAPGGTALCKAAGVTQITASDAGDSGTGQLTCLRVPNVISISPNPVSMTTAQSTHFTAVATAPGGTTSDVTMLSSWTSSLPSIATVAPGGTALCKAAGVTQITASDTGDSGTAQLTCLRAPSVISISPNPISMNTAESTHFTALATAPGGTTSDVTMLSSWASSLPSIATVAPGGTALCKTAGITQITASDEGDSGTAQLTCLRVPRVISISPNTVSMNTAQSTHFTALATAPGGATSDVTMLSSWTSSLPLIASVASDGTAICRVVGVTQITASQGGDSGTAQLTCLRSPNVISISPNPVSLDAAQSTHFTAVATAPGGSTTDVTMLSSWASSLPLIATIAADGTALCKMAGITQITASDEGDSGTAQLTCLRGQATTLHLTATPPVIRSNVPYQYQLVADYPDGTTMDLTSSATWNTDPIVASVPTAGLVACNHPGQATLTASFGGLTIQTSFICILQAITPTPGFAESGKTFDGPFASWVNVKTSFGAKGDGVTDDTVALQAALDSLIAHPGVLWIPHGNYILTSSLHEYSQAGVSLVGEDPQTTTITWKGSGAGTMYSTLGSMGSSVKRLTWDGSGIAWTGINITLESTAGSPIATRTLIQDSRIMNVAVGVYYYFAGETTISRVHFDHDGWGVVLNTPNTTNINIVDCLFTDNSQAVTNWSNTGSFNVTNSVFVRSTAGDVFPGSTNIVSLRNNLSVDSHAFLISAKFAGPGDFVIQGNTIVRPGSTPIQSGKPALIMLLDNAFIGLDPTFNLIKSTSTVPLTFISAGNTYSVATPFAGTIGKYTSVDESQLPADAPFTMVVPSEIYVPPSSHRQVFEVPAGSSDATLQTAIDSATSVGGVVHLPPSDLQILHTLKIAEGASVALIGDGTFSNLVADPTLQGPLLESFGKTVQVEELRFSSNATSSTSTSLEIHVPDNPSTRFYCAECTFSLGTTAFEMDGLDDAAMEMRVATLRTNAVAMAIHGGSARQNKVQTLGTMAAYMTSSAEYTVDNGAHFLINDGWHDVGQGNIQSRLIGSGNVTQQGGVIYSGSNQAMTLENYTGSLSLLGVAINAAATVYAGSSANILTAAVLQLQGLDPITNYEPEAKIAELDNGLSATSNSPVPMPDLPATPPLIETMMAAARTVTLSHWMPQTTNATSVKIERVEFNDAPTGLRIASSGPAATGTYTIRPGGAEDVPTQGACSQSETTLAGNWTLQDGGDGFQGLSLSGSILSESFAQDNDGDGTVFVRQMTNARDRWLMKQVGDGTVTVINRATGNLLSRTSTGCVYAAKGTGNTNQHWLIDAVY